MIYLGNAKAELLIQSHADWQCSQQRLKTQDVANVLCIFNHSRKQHAGTNNSLTTDILAHHSMGSR